MHTHTNKEYNIKTVVSETVDVATNSPKKNQLPVSAPIPIPEKPKEDKENETTVFVGSPSEDPDTEASAILLNVSLFNQKKQHVYEKVNNVFNGLKDLYKINHSC